MKRKTVLVILGILIIALFTLRISYAFIKDNIGENATSNIEINTCAKIQLTDNDNNSINLENTYPMDDEAGMATKGYEFSVTNTCEEDISFNLYLTSITTNEIEDNDVKYAITDIYNNVLVTGLLSEADKGEEELTSEEIKEIEVGIKETHKNIYRVYNNKKYVNVKPTNEDNKFKLYLWVDENAENDTMAKRFKLGLSVKAVDFDGEYVKDLSGNNYDGQLKNGTIIKTDEEGRQGLFFDGVDDYVDIADLPASINWDGGFTIEFEAKWSSLNSGSRIFDFGNGESVDNIFLTNNSTTNGLEFDSRYEATSRGCTLAKDIIEVNSVQKYKVEVVKNSDSYTHNIYKDNELFLTKTYNVTSYVRNVLRTENFLGKSNWPADKYFNGYIYNFKITDSLGNVVIWYDFANEIVRDLSGNGNYGKTVNIARWDDEGITTSDENTNGYVDCGLAGYDFKDSVSLIVRVRTNKFTETNHQRMLNNYGGGNRGTGIATNDKRSYMSSWMAEENKWKHTENPEQNQTNTWYTIVGTYDGKAEKIFVNGVLKKTLSTTGNILVSEYPFFIGKGIGTNDATLATYAEALIFDRGLTEEEVAKDYANEINPTNKQDLLLWYKFN